MILSKILAFDVWGEYACFRRPYSTTSPLTYPFPTRTALSGMVAAILGLERDSYYQDFSDSNCKMGIQFLSPLKKTYIGQNLIDTRRGFFLWDISKNPRTQILFEVLKDVQFRIYLWLKNDELAQSLEKHLLDHTSIYTPYFGLANMLANFKFVNIYKDIMESEDIDVGISTVVPESYGVRYSSDHKIGRVRIPISFDNDRVPRYDTLIYDGCDDFIDTHNLIISRGKYYNLDKELNIVMI